MSWNGEYFVSYGNRLWEDAGQYGSVSGGGGGGPFYSRTLSMLSPGDRISVCLPGKGYAGVGTITEGRQPIMEFKVDSGARLRPVLEVLANATEYQCRSLDPDDAKY